MPRLHRRERLRIERLAGELADQRMQRAAPCAFDLQQRLVGQRGQQRQRGAGDLVRGRAREAAGKHRQRRQRLLLARRQALPRLLERRAHAAVLGPLLAVVGAFEHVERACELRVDLGHRQQPHPVCGEQDRERQPARGVHERSRSPALRGRLRSPDARPVRLLRRAAPPRWPAPFVGRCLRGGSASPRSGSSHSPCAPSRVRDVAQTRRRGAPSISRSSRRGSSARCSALSNTSSTSRAARWSGRRTSAPCRPALRARRPMAARAPGAAPCARWRPADRRWSRARAAPPVLPARPSRAAVPAARAGDRAARPAMHASGLPLRRSVDRTAQVQRHRRSFAADDRDHRAEVGAAQSH